MHGKTLAGLAIIAATAATAGCGSSSSNTSSSNQGSSNSAPDLKSQLLTTGDLPSGWSVDTSAQSNDTTGEPQCLLNLKKDVNPQQKAQANFQQSNGIPSLEEDLGWFPGAAQDSLGKIGDALNSCGTITFTADGNQFTGNVSPLSFPTEADQSQAWQINLSSPVNGSTVSLGIDVIGIRKGSDELALLLYVDQGTPDANQVQQIAGSAAGKLSG